MKIKQDIKKNETTKADSSAYCPFCVLLLFLIFLLTSFVYATELNTSILMEAEVSTSATGTYQVPVQVPPQLCGKVAPTDDTNSILPFAYDVVDGVCTYWVRLDLDGNPVKLLFHEVNDASEYADPQGTFEYYYDASMGVPSDVVTERVTNVYVEGNALHVELFDLGARYLFNYQFDPTQYVAEMYFWVSTMYSGGGLYDGTYYYIHRGYPGSRLYVYDGSNAVDSVSADNELFGNLALVSFTHDGTKLVTTFNGSPVAYETAPAPSIAGLASWYGATTTYKLYWYRVRKKLPADLSVTLTYHSDINIYHEPTSVEELALDPENGKDEVNVTYTAELETSAPVAVSEGTLYLTGYRVDLDSLDVLDAYTGQPTVVEGKFGGAIYFDGNSMGKLVIPHLPADGDWTFCLVFKLPRGLYDHVAFLSRLEQLEPSTYYSMSLYNVVNGAHALTMSTIVNNQYYDSSQYLATSVTDYIDENGWNAACWAQKRLSDGKYRVVFSVNGSVVLDNVVTRPIDHSTGVLYLGGRSFTELLYPVIVDEVILTRFFFPDLSSELVDPTIAELAVTADEALVKSVTKSYAAVGDYNECISFDVMGEDVSACDTVHIDMYPQISSIEMNTQIPFANEHISLSANVVDNGTVSYEWNFDTDNLVFLGGTTKTLSISLDKYAQVYEVNIDVKATTLPVFIKKITFSIYTAGACDDYPSTYNIYFNNELVYSFRVDEQGYVPDGEATFTRYAYINRAIPAGETATIRIKLVLSASCTLDVAQLSTPVSDNYIVVDTSKYYMSYITRIFSIEYDVGTTKDIVVSYASSGTYHITLTVTDDVGLSKSISKSIPIYSTPEINAPSSDYIDKDITATIEYDTRLHIVTSEWNTTDENAIVTPYLDHAIFHFLTLEDQNITAYITLADDQNNEREVNLTHTISINPITLSITVKNEEDGSVWDTSTVDLTRIEVWDDETDTFIGSKENSNTYSITNLTRHHLYRVVLTIQGSGITYTRTYYVKGYDMSLTAYAIDPTKGVYYTLFVTDLQNNPLEGYFVEVRKFISDAYVPINLPKSSIDGSTMHFVVPATYYKVYVKDPKENIVKEFTWYADPNVRQLFIRVDMSTRTEINLTSPWEGLDVTVTENNGIIKVSIVDTQNRIEEYRVQIAKTIFSELAYYDQTFTGNPPGGTVEFNASNMPGVYTIRIWVKINGETYEFPPIQINISGTPYFSGPLGISDFSYILIAVIVTFIVVGFTAQFSPGASGILGLVVLGFFTLLNPTATVAGLTMWQIFLVTALIVLGISFVRTYI